MATLATITHSCRATCVCVCARVRVCVCVCASARVRVKSLELALSHQSDAVTGAKTVMLFTTVLTPFSQRGTLIGVY